MTESDVKREIVRILLKEGTFARRIEDKYAIGTLDMLIVTPMHVIYAEAKKLVIGRASLMTSAMQQDQIKRFNAVGNGHARAIVIGYRDGQLGFGLPGDRWNKHHTCPWPCRKLTDQFDLAMLAIFGDSNDECR